MEIGFSWHADESKLFSDYFFQGNESKIVQELSEKNVDELFETYNDLVDDWKQKLEWIVADGLKKLRKSSKEKKLMIKYLPGSKMTDEAKDEIISELRSEFIKAIGSTSKKLDKLSTSKVKEIEKVTFNKVQKNAKTVENKVDVRKLIEELDQMCQVMSNKDPMIPKIPMFRPDNDWKKQIVPASQQLPLQTWQNLLNYLSNQHDPTVEEIFHKLDGNGDSGLKAPKAIKKVSSRLTNTNIVKAQHRMLQRKVNRVQKEEPRNRAEKFHLREFKRGGKKHFIVVKKKEPVEVPVEEIFVEWKDNLEPIQKTQKRTPRVRKLSHRAQRKAQLKEPIKPKVPLLYSDVVKHNLKLLPDSMEDIFESWRDHLRELEQLLVSDATLEESEPEEVIHHTSPVLNMGAHPTFLPRSLPKYKLEPEVVFAAWRHNLMKDAPLVRYPIKGPQPEDHFAAWRHHMDETQQTRAKAISSEDCFACWRGIFESTPPMRHAAGPNPEPEEILRDWLPLFDDYYDDIYLLENDHSLKNKKRGQRKSTHSNKKKRQF